MRNILFLALGLFITVTVFGQIPAANDSLKIDSANISNQTILSHSEQVNLKNATKADADSAYIKNDYYAAIQIYESLLMKGESADIYYNLGNSYYKADEIAKAILNYERALLLQPGNSDIRANLEVARSKTIDKVEPTPEIFIVSWVKSLINSMSVNAWAVWAVIAFIFFIVALYLFIFTKRILLKKIGFISGIIFLMITVSANIFASKQKERLLNRDNAVIIAPSVTVRSTPSESGTSLFILHEGSEVNIKDNSMKDWKEIRLEDGKVGWVSTSDLEVI